MNRPRTTRPEVAAAELGVDPNPSPSALAWSVAHAVAIECGRKPEDAAAIADRWATVADIVGEAPPEWVRTGHDELTHRSVFQADYAAVEARVLAMDFYGGDVRTNARCKCGENCRPGFCVNKL